MEDLSHTPPRFKAVLKRRIESLDAPADIKLLLEDLLDATLVVGGKVIQIGAKILEIIFEFAKAYPGLAVGVVFALVLAYLFGAIPVLGPVLSPVLTPLLLIIGMSLGGVLHLIDTGMKVKLDQLGAVLSFVGPR